jgi:outer membrane protein TolC
VSRVEREQRSSRALLNALMNRPADAPLGPPEDLSVTPATNVAALEKNIDANRPEVAAAARGIRRDEAALDGARRAARFPQVMVGVDYWYMPTFPSDMRNAYSAMVAITLPWLSGRRAADQREAEEALQADRAALASTQNTVRYELRDAAARVDSGNAVGLLDALRSYLQVRIERVRALAELAVSETDLERAAGTLLAEGEER